MTETVVVNQSAGATDSDQARQVAVSAHGLDRASRNADSDLELLPLAIRAKELSGADVALLSVIDDRYEVIIASSVPMPIRIVARDHSLAEYILGRKLGSNLFAIADAAAHAELKANPWVNGTMAKVRFFAAAPLVDRDGNCLGILSIVSLTADEDLQARCLHLGEVRDEVMQVLELRRQRSEEVAGTDPVGDQAGLQPARPQRDSPIDAIIDRRAVQTLFQPVVHLATGATVGFEAFIRGPAATELETLDALLVAAEQVGRVGELDWVCRINAMQAAAASGLHPSLSWFLNVAPAGLASECPEDLRPALSHARQELRIVLDVVQRPALDYLLDLLHTTDQAGQDAWGVALTGVGADATLLPMLPLLQPDAIKLDMSAFTGIDAPLADTTAAVRAYAERRGAVIIATGIDTERQRQLAEVFGATYGQGTLLGKPRPLPKSVAVPRDVIPLKRREESTAAHDTPYQVLSQDCATTIAPKQLLRHIARRLETHSAEHNERCVILLALEPGAVAGVGAQQRYRELARRNVLTIVVSQDVDSVIEPGLHLAPLGGPSAMSQEWVSIVIGPHYAAAFVARDLGDTGPDDERRFQFCYVHDRPKVVTAARSYVRQLQLAQPRTANLAPMPEPDDTADPRRGETRRRLSFRH